MEPRIIKGHIYLCKETLKGSYRKGRIYECQHNDTMFNDTEMTKFSCGFITNDQGNTGHAWPYDPANHPWATEKDKWTDYFKDLGEKPAGMIIAPYEVGDMVKWYCDDDGKVHRSKVTGLQIKVGKTGIPYFTFTTRIKFKGTMQDASFSMREVSQAEGKSY